MSRWQLRKMWQWRARIRDASCLRESGGQSRSACQVKSLGSTTEQQGHAMAGKAEVNWDVYFDIKMRDVGTQTILQETVAAEQGGSKMVDCQTHWVGHWEPLEEHQDRVGARVRLRFDGLPHRLKSRGVPAGEQGTYLGMKSSGDCLVRYDNWTDGSMLDVLEDFEVCVPRFTTASTQTQAEQILQLADSGHFLSMQLDPGAVLLKLCHAGPTLRT